MKNIKVRWPDNECELDDDAGPDVDHDDDDAGLDVDDVEDEDGGVDDAVGDVADDGDEADGDIRIIMTNCNCSNNFINNTN